MSKKVGIRYVSVDAYVTSKWLYDKYNFKLKIALFIWVYYLILAIMSKVIHSYPQYLWVYVYFYINSLNFETVYFNKMPIKIGIFMYFI